ncbi:hypothetical protein SQ03_15735 [Methylobacterium platani JCM 14648]|uniref:Uncharacterized protein n=2 Tax=Methylobacterium platani TaxID=427683 RepID=A0A179SBS2_9HYPH|nr:hypothetical protein SQ03_15735 [Methylobacterium platani JCM 14648]OAS24845.1 hypothetical protein A5481_12175 [Methylobacterium platani]
MPPPGGQLSGSYRQDLIRKQGILGRRPGPVSARWTAFGTASPRFSHLAVRAASRSAVYRSASARACASARSKVSEKSDSCRPTARADASLFVRVAPA